MPTRHAVPGAVFLTAFGLLLCTLAAAAGAEAPRPSAPWVTRAIQAPGVQFLTFDSQAAQARISYHVYLPPDYAAQPDRRWPVLYWLHGSGPGERGIAALAAYFDAAIRAGKIPPLIIVFPNGLPNGMWCNSKDGLRPLETVFVAELVPLVDANFRTLASRAGRLLEGFSMGGYGAARLGFKYPELFGTVSMLGAGPLQLDFSQAPDRGGHPARDRTFQAAFGGDQAYFAAQSPWLLAAEKAETLRQGLRLRQIIGEQDFTLGFNRDFDARLTQLGIPHTFTVLPGVKHDAMAVLHALGEENWVFYRAVFGEVARWTAGDEGP